MTKTIEEELGTHFGRLDKALEGLVKTYEKFIHGISPEQRAAVFTHMRSKLAATETRLQLAGASAGGFSFQQPVQPMQGGPLYVQMPAPGVLGPTGTIRSDVQTIPTAQPHQAPEAPTRPIGRLARTGSDPDAGKVLVAPPIKSTRPPPPTDNDGTVGFLGSDSKEAKIDAL